MTIHRSLALALTFSFLILPPALAQSKEPIQKVEVEKGQIEIEVQNISFIDLCDKIGKKLKINLLVSPGIEEKVSLRLSISNRRILYRVLEGITQSKLEKVAKNAYLFTRPPNNRLHLKGTTLHDLLLNLASSSAKNLVIASTVPDTPIQSIKAERFYPTELMARVAQVAGCIVEKNGEYVRVLGPRKSINLGSKTDEIFFRFSIQPTGEEDTKPKKKTEKLKNISVDVVDLELTKVLSQIGQKTGWVFAVNPKIQSKVTVTLRDISPMDALKIVLKLTNCKFRLYKKCFHVDPVVKIRLSKKGVEIREIVKLLSKRMGRKVEIPAELKGKVSVYFEDLEAEFALAFLISAVTDKVVLDEFGKDLRLVDQPRRQAKKPNGNTKEAVKKEQFKKLKAALKKRSRAQIDKLFFNESDARKLHYPKIIADFAKSLPDSEEDSKRGLMAQSKRLFAFALQCQADAAYQRLDFRRVVNVQQKLKRQIALLKDKTHWEDRLARKSLLRTLVSVEKQIEDLRPLKKLKLRFQGALINASQYSPTPKSFALISGRHYFEKEAIRDHEGRKIENLTVYSFTEESVTLKFKDLRVTLQRPPSK